MSGDAAAVTNVTLMPNIGYDPRRDFRPDSARSAARPTSWCVRKDLAATDARRWWHSPAREPGKLTFASTGIGTSQHLGGEILCQMTGIRHGPRALQGFLRQRPDRRPRRHGLPPTP
jgi:tripartite-type tricarboxylate transporter receptor subunit TctC